MPTSMRTSIAVLQRNCSTRTWELLDMEKRTPAQDEEMVHTAHASRYHWGIVGTPLNFGRGEWQIARVYSTLGRDDSAQHHAQLYLDACTEHDFEAFDLAFAHEGMARSLSKRDPKTAAEHINNARHISQKISNDQDRAWAEKNLVQIEMSMTRHD